MLSYSLDQRKKRRQRQRRSAYLDCCYFQLPILFLLEVVLLLLIAPFGLFSIANCLRNIENVSNCIAKILARIMLCGNLH
ncbi:hypothetical protein AAC387_Pa09g0235 [Persea americana]